MRLKSLDIHGFKSFPDRTKIRFSEGMTVIVGPNGSGKSNISDAIRWVLGELSSKNIRGNKMEDVIFGGTDGRSPMSFAEVTLTIENSGESRIDSEFDEISVTRRYYRSGDSEYLINNKPARLRDITEMFMNTGIGKTGYSIVGQGRVSEIISQKSEERRIIFEEAAGISKYRYKKQDAERRLAETDDNLVRISDIVGELSSRVGPLERDAAKAKIYLDLYGRKKALDIALAIFDVDRINSGIEQTKRDYLVAKQELELSDGAIASYERRLELLSEKQAENRSAYEAASGRSEELVGRLHSLESTLLVAQNELSHRENDLESLQKSLETRNSDRLRIEGELTSYSQNSKNAEAELAELIENQNTLAERLEHSRQDYQTSEAALERLDAQKAEILRRHTEARIALSALDESKQTIGQRRIELTRSLEEMDGRITLIQEKIAAVRKAAGDYQLRLTALTQRRNSLLTSSEDRRKKLAELEHRYQNLQTDISSKQQRALTLRRMEEHFEGYSRSVKFVADAAVSGRLSGICGPVSKLISVDRQYSVAIETALGANLQNIVVENESAAKAAISLLKRENQGRSTFYPITSMKPTTLNLAPSVRSASGYIGVAAELVSFDRRYFPVLSSLLGRTVVFDNLDNASVVAKASGYAFRIVTLDGQIINAGGSFTGGSAKRESGILTRSVEIEEILASMKESEQSAAEIRQQIDELSSASDENREELERISQDHSLVSALCKAEETALSMQSSQLADRNAERDGILRSIESLDQRESEKELERARLIHDCSCFTETEAAIGDEMKKALEVKNACNALLEQQIAEKNDLLVTVSVKKKEVEVLNDRLDRLTADRERTDSEIEQTGQRILENREAQASLTAKIGEDSRALADLKKEIGANRSNEDALTHESLDIEREMNELRQKSKQEGHQRELIFTRYTTLSSKMESTSIEKAKITDKLWEEYELSYSDAQATDYEPITEETRSSKVGEISKLRSKIRELGSVNVGAIEEYSAVKERYEFLSGQLSDLEKSKKEFTEIITRLESEMCVRFSETFEKVNENFKVVFRELFGGGSGSLSLTDPENVLTSGIEINVTPPGKIIHNLKLLSGGEQVFVAIGIFFAILKVNPSPFCLLDEIESALDEVNVDRFAAYAKEFTGNTQFIIITHRRGTMEEADTLYGVTMQEKGISKILSISVSEVEQKLGVKLDGQ